MDENSDLINFLKTNKKEIEEPKKVSFKPENIIEKLNNDTPINTLSRTYFPKETFYFALVLLIIGLIIFGLSCYYKKNENELT